VKEKNEERRRGIKIGWINERTGKIHGVIGTKGTNGIKERKKEIILFIILDESSACCDIT
jgi:hypothetical protein